MPLAEYNQRIGRFVGVILPGEAEFRIHRDTKGVEFGAATKLFEDTPAPSADDFGNIMHSLEAPYNGPAAKPAPEHTWHVANINIAADIFESVQPAEILHFLDAEFSRVEH